MKIYLDTNIILDWFRNIMISAKTHETFKIPKKLEFITSQNIEFLVNLMHLQIAKKEDLWFLTGEKDLAWIFLSAYL